jgi:hypothetical protein
MKMKTGHAVLLLLAVVGGLYVLHMMCNHAGQGIVPSFGTH